MKMYRIEVEGKDGQSTRDFISVNFSRDGEGNSCRFYFKDLKGFPKLIHFKTSSTSDLVSIKKRFQVTELTEQEAIEFEFLGTQGFQIMEGERFASF